MVSSHRRCLRTIACGRRETCHGEALRQLSEGGGKRYRHGAVVVQPPRLREVTRDRQWHE